jgi:hypothetical protein
LLKKQKAIKKAGQSKKKNEAINSLEEEKFLSILANYLLIVFY